MLTNLSATIQNIWCSEIKKGFQNGIFCSERQLQAELYHHLRMELSDFEIWVEPTIILTSKNGDWKIIPDLVITEGTKIVSVIELKYNPAAEVYVLPDFEKLYALSQLNDQVKFNLKWIYIKDRKAIPHSYWISADLLCVYAAIAGDHAWGVKDRKFWKENNYNEKIPVNFLHLVGRVYKDKECEFVNADI